MVDKEESCGERPQIIFYTIGQKENNYILWILLFLSSDLVLQSKPKSAAQVSMVDHLERGEKV